MGNDRFIEVFVDTPLEVCEQRDPKGMYALAREGQLKGFTGVDDPYEPPHNPEITINTVTHSAEENAERIISYLVAKAFIKRSLHEVEYSDVQLDREREVELISG